MMTTSTALQSHTGPEIGKYHLVAELARGGMGNVYLAVSQGPGGFNKLVVVKELKPELSDDETYVAMFLDEARLAARLIHPNVVQTNEVGSEGSRHYMVMEYLDGRSVHRIGKRFAGRFPISAHLRIISEALLGLHYAHELREFDGEPLGIVHRDVSPLNLFVTFAGQAKVLDFGIAKAVDSSLETKMGVLKGRVAYMAPEQAKGGRVDRRADIYSAGVMIWEAAAGRRLWPGLSELEILTEIVRGGPPSLRTVRPDVPTDLEHICARAMACDPDERYATARDLLHDLEAHLARRADTMTMREVGALVGQAFADERRKMNAVIDEALTRVRGGPRSGVMPTFQAQFVGTPTNAQIADGLPLTARLHTQSHSLLPQSGASSYSHLSHSAPATSATLGSVQAPPQFRPWTSRRVAILGCTLGAIFMVAAAFGAALRGGGKVTSAAPPSTTEAVRMAGVPTSARSEPFVDLVARVSPASAQIAIDGAAAAGNPFRTRYPKDNQIHHIVLSADGYESKLVDVSFASDVSVDVSLDRRTSAPTAAARPAKRSAAPPPPPPAATPSVQQPDVHDAPSPAAARFDVNPLGGRAPLRPIATSNPYGNP